MVIIKRKAPIVYRLAHEVFSLVERVRFSLGVIMTNILCVALEREDMGWGGSQLFDSVIEVVELYVPAESRKSAYRLLIDAFRGEDWDTLDECLGKSSDYDAVYKEIYPETKMVD